MRVNALALALTHLWKRPLPEVMKEHIGDPIGMSDTWHWEGYDGTAGPPSMASAHQGGERRGGHWGGGMFLSAYDQARGWASSGLNKGQWNGKSRAIRKMGGNGAHADGT